MSAGPITRFRIVRTTEVSEETLIAAVNAYLALGLVFAFLYSALGFSGMGEFRGEAVAGPLNERLQGFIYFSFVTLTTLGYGDVTPVQPVGRTLAYLEALAGQFYMALTIARIVGIYVARRTSPRD